jgi:hypothetical protein
MNYGTILLVGDNPENLRLIELVLFNEGFTVETANSATEALEGVGFESAGRAAYRYSDAGTRACGRRLRHVTPVFLISVRGNLPAM